MRLPIDIGTPLPEPPRDIRTYINNLVEDLEWCYSVAREVSGHQHRRSEARYNERVVDKLYEPGLYVRVLKHGRHFGTPSKLVAPYSGLCEVIRVRKPVLTLRELDTRREFTANHDAVRPSSLRPPIRAQPADEPPPRDHSPPPVASNYAAPLPQRPDRRDASRLSNRNVELPAPNGEPQQTRVVSDSQRDATRPEEFNGPPPVGKKPPRRLMDIQCTDIGDADAPQTANDVAPPPLPDETANRRPKRNALPPRHLDDYQLGATNSNLTAVASNNEYSGDADLTIGYSYLENKNMLSVNAVPAQAISKRAATTPVDTPCGQCSGRPFF